MASVTFKRGTKAEIENTQIQDGQLLMETDQLNNNKIYLDLPNGTRVPVGGSGAWVGTKEEFELAVEEGKIADGTQVIITDDYESGITASMTLYSNSQSGLVATNVQSAIDEVSAKIGQENISQVGNSVTGAINNLNSNLSEIPKIQYKEISATTDSNGYVELDVFALSARVLTSATPGNYTCLIHGYKTTAQNNSNALVVKSAYNMANIVNTNMTFGILYMC